MTIFCSCGHIVTCDPEDGLNYVICPYCDREYEVEVSFSQVSSYEEDD